MRLHYAGTDLNGIALVHLVVVGLECQHLGLVVCVRDGGLSCGLQYKDWGHTKVLIKRSPAPDRSACPCRDGPWADD